MIENQIHVLTGRPGTPAEEWVLQQEAEIERWPN
jgi:hypothetical protein